MLEGQTLIAAIVYLALAGAYLLVIPAGLYLYLQKRWYIMGSIERLLAYFFVFAFFPGMLVLSPILNLRPEKRAL